MLEPNASKGTRPILRRGRAITRSFLFDNDEMYEDETGSQKGEVQKRKIVETEIFSVDERITIIRGTITIMGKKEGEST
jgi:hypothetical protein